MTGLRRTKTLEGARRVSPSGLRGHYTLLIADDDALVLRQIRAGLEDTGYSFLEAADGAQALTALREHHPDLLLLDVEMPGMGGVEVCRIVKANQGVAGFGFVPVILMAARRTGSKVEGLELGADDYLSKPIDMLELSARVKSMLRLKALQDELIEKNRALDRANQELEHKRIELLQLSRTDGLTGLVNRRHFDERLEAEFSRSMRYGAALSCFMLDIDHFKRINDTWGHPFGDVVIREVAQEARRALRDIDVLARYGGEELVALLPETSAPDALRVAERIRLGIESLRLQVQDDEGLQAVPCTASLGVASVPAEGVTTGPGLVHAADAALYTAKQSGRNRVAMSGI